MTTLRERFLAKIAVNPMTGCWLWTARIDASGYGRLNRGPGVSPMAHRFAYEEFVGPIPGGMQLDHLCRTRRCVNPEHLEPVTNRQNALRGESFAAVNASKTKCTAGHELAGENVRVRERRGSTERECLICARTRKRAYKQRLRARAA
jgi:hypothetical protein